MRQQSPVVLITRPEGQQLAFADGCRALGYTIALLPCLQILPCRVDQDQLDTLLATHNTALFTSVNAVKLAHEQRPLPWPDHQVHAIGGATAKALEHLQQPVTLVPQAPFTSESYLEQLAHQPSGSLLIIKGCGGRDLIQSRLTARGWHVGSIAVYERVLPNIDSQTIDTLFVNCVPDIISVTSNETLTNLCKLCSSYKDTLTSIPLIANSQRCAQLASELGFRHTTLVANPAGDQGQLACLAHWKKTRFDTR